MTTSEQKEKATSLVKRYYTWERLVLGTSLLLIFWKVFGLIDTTNLPLLHAVLHDPNKFPHATCIILLVELFYMWISWKQSDETARHDTFSRIGFCATFALAFFAVWIKAYFFFYDEEGWRVPFRQNISNRREIFKTHDYLLYVNRHGSRLAAEVEVPLNATPQKVQQIYRSHIIKNWVRKRIRQNCSPAAKG
jgi:hypothetical protein